MPDESSLQLDEDIRLMIRAREGDRSAYEKLYRRYFHTVASFMARRTGCSPDCEDLVQEVFTRVWEHRAKYRPGRVVRSYLLGFAKNVFREHRARICREDAAKRHQSLRPMKGAGMSPEMVARRNDEARCVRACLARLPTKQRQAAELVYLVQMPVAEAAKVMGCSPEALRQSLYEARRRLKTGFFFAGEEQELP